MRSRLDCIFRPHATENRVRPRGKEGVDPFPSPTNQTCRNSHKHISSNLTCARESVALETLSAGTRVAPNRVHALGVPVALVLVRGALVHVCNIHNTRGCVTSNSAWAQRSGAKGRSCAHGPGCTCACGSGSGEACGAGAAEAARGVDALRRRRALAARGALVYV